MKIGRVTQSVVELAFVLVVAAPAAAQQSSAAGASGAAPVGAVGLTYSILRSDAETSAVGVGLDISRRVARSSNGVDVQVAVDIGVNHFAASTDFDATTQTSFMAGVRFAGRGNASAVPFAQLLAGGIHCCGATDPAVAFGAGVDVPIAQKKANLRLQVDVPVAYYQAGIDADEVPYDAGRTVGVRVNIGVSIPFGR